LEKRRLERGFEAGKDFAKVKSAKVKSAKVKSA